jgi:hypothetical protein
MKFRKKPVVVEAIQWTGTNLDEVLAFCLGGASLWGKSGPTKDRELIIETREDGSEHQVEHIASVNDWIIKGIKGEFYPCKPDIFAATYEPAE